MVSLVSNFGVCLWYHFNTGRFLVKLVNLEFFSENNLSRKSVLSLGENVVTTITYRPAFRLVRKNMCLDLM